MTDLSGRSFGNYRLEALVGSGGMGQVYRAVHIHLGRTVAVKVVHGHLAADPSFQARFVREANAAAGLNHPNIVKIHDFGEQQGRAYLVMELATGGSLRTLLQRRVTAGQPLPWLVGVPLVLQAADALEYAHGSGMVHRDIKPDNLLLNVPDGYQATAAADETYHVKICDFGLAQLRHDGRITATGVTVGTPAYISPEQCQGMDLDGRSDLYSLGIVLYEIATGYLPFETKNMGEALYKHVNTAPPAPRGVQPDLPLGLEAAILRCLAKKPDDRYATAGQLAAALRTVLASITPEPGHAPSAERLLVSRARAAPIDATLVPGPLGAVAPGAIGERGSQLERPLLVVLDREGSVQRTAALDESGVVVGRGAESDVTLEDVKISRRHVRIQWDGRRVTLTDLDSVNGTLIGSARLLPNVVQEWPAGADVNVGAFVLRLAPATGAGNGSRGDGAEGPPPPPAPPGIRGDSSNTGDGADRRAAGAAAPGESPAATELLVAGADGMLRRAATLRPGGSVTVGRLAGNDVLLDDDRISRHHLRVEWDGHAARVTDLGSTNGAWIGGERIPAREATPWAMGADLTLGPYWLRLGAGGEAGEALPAAAAIAPGSTDESLAAANAELTSARLLAVDADGQMQVHIDLPTGGVFVGRGEENHLVVDDRTVSRRHVRVDWDGRQATVTDLSSDNGTWLGEERLVAGEPRPWPAEQLVRVGPIRLRFEAAPLPAVSPADSPEASHHTQMGRVQMLLEQHTLALVPGEPALVRGTLANLGTVVDHFHVSVQGVPEPWVSGDALRQGDNEKFQLVPRGQASVVLQVYVPRVPESTAGEYPVNIIAHSTREAGEIGVAHAAWTVMPFAGSALSMDRVRAAGRRGGAYGVVVENRGNAPDRYTLSAQDEEGRLRFRFDPSAVDVGPGQTAALALRVRAPWQLFGMPQVRPYSVRLAPASGSPPAPVAGEFLHRPLVPPWVLGAVAASVPILLILAILLQSFLLGMLRPRIASFDAPRSVVAGEPVALAWRVDRAQQIHIEGLETTPAANPTPLPAQGTVVLQPGLSKDQEFTLIASNFFGPVEQSRPISVATLTPTPTGTPSPTASPTPVPEVLRPVVEEFCVRVGAAAPSTAPCDTGPRSILLGEQVTIAWRVRDAQSVMVEGLSTGQLSASGQLSQRPERSTTYVLTASNQGLPAEPQSREVIVRTPTPSPTPPPTATPRPTGTP